jgi:hypothetical protein
MANDQEIFTLAAVWVRAPEYCTRSGEPMETINQRIKDGIWAAGKHYKRLSQRVLFINVPEVTKWINQQPHVEALTPRGLKSGPVRAANG